MRQLGTEEAVSIMTDCATSAGEAEDSAAFRARHHSRVDYGVLGLMTTRPFVTIAMPALNEEGFIESAVRSLLPDRDVLDCEVLVLDGGSTDRTAEIVSQLSREDSRIRLVPNPKRIQSSAVNLAAAIADPRATILLRADCHSVYPDRFVERAVASLERTGVASIVVPMNTKGRSWMQSAIAAAQNSVLGNGGSAHRHVARSRFVDHGHHAAFRLADFKAIGGYDETFTHNEDAELDTRLTASGRKIFLDADLSIDYFPRATLGSLARQYWNYGKGRARTVLKHRTSPKIRQLAPVGLLIVSAAGLILSPFNPLALAVPLGYVAGCTAWGLLESVRSGESFRLASGIAAVVMHMSWAAGFLATLAHSGVQASGESAQPVTADLAGRRPRAGV